MPSGSYVLVRPYDGSGYPNRPGTYLNIYVYPLRADAYQTTGLCGNYNLNPNDDIPAGDCTANCDTHRQVHTSTRYTVSQKMGHAYYAS